MYRFIFATGNTGIVVVYEWTLAQARDLMGLAGTLARVELMDGTEVTPDAAGLVILTDGDDTLACQVL